MKNGRFKIFMAAVLWSGAAAPARAFQLGLGSAVAGEGSKVADKAGIPSCGGRRTLFTRAPVTDPALRAVVPLGHLYSTGHIFPGDHMYFNFSPHSAGDDAKLYAPSDGWVVQITRVDFIRGYGGPNPDHFLAFSPCKEVRLNFMHVGYLSPVLEAQANRCDRTDHSSSGGEESDNCTTYTLVPVHAGDLLGRGVIGDFGPLEDSRRDISGFANPGRHDLHRGFCPLDYFSTDVQAAWTSKIGGFDDTGGVFNLRTTAPVCGTIMQDVPGTAQGDWYFPGSSGIPEDPNLALVHDNIFPSTATFSVGTSVPGLTGINHIFPKTAPDGSRINYDFNLVDDGQIYCYESFHVFPQATTPFGGSLPGRIVLIQLSGQSKADLRIELQTAASCAGAAPWAFTAAAVDFKR